MQQNDFLHHLHVISLLQCLRGTHSYGFFLACLWMCMCLFKQTALINSLEHKSHVTTDSRVCSSLCAFKLSRRVKAEPQSSQMNFFSFLCPAMCRLRSALLTNALSHSVHLCRLSPNEKRQHNSSSNLYLNTVKKSSAKN